MNVNPDPNANSDPTPTLTPTQAYPKQAVAKKSLWEMGLQIFRSHLHARAEVTRKTVHGLLSLIESERNGDQVARPL